MTRGLGQLKAEVVCETHNAVSAANVGSGPDPVPVDSPLVFIPSGFPLVSNPVECPLGTSSAEITPCPSSTGQLLSSTLGSSITCFTFVSPPGVYSSVSSMAFPTVGSMAVAWFPPASNSSLRLVHHGLPCQFKMSSLQLVAQ